MQQKKPIIFTIGHSTNPIEEFIEILKAHKIKEIVDVRTIPKSRHNPQFNQEELQESLKQAQIKYKLLKKLGGLLKILPISAGTMSPSEVLPTIWEVRNSKKG